MSTTQTTNLGLTKATPGTGEPFSTSVVNTNLDTIDSAVGELQDSVSSKAISVTKSSKINNLVVNAYSVAGIAIVSYYFVPNTNLVRGDVVATFDIASTFKMNFFNEKVNLKVGTKDLTADTSFQSGSSNSGIIVGVF